MTDDHDTVRGDTRVELQGRYAEAERFRESRQSVLRHQTTRAAMALQVERHCSIRAETQENSEGRPAQPSRYQRGMLRRSSSSSQCTKSGPS